MIIVIGSDHGGYEVKENLKKYLLEKGYDIIDVGTNSLDSCNYAEFAIKAANKVSGKEANCGILICTSGEGVCIAANKVKGIRCGIGYNDDVSRLLKEHNDANMIAFGAHYQTFFEITKRVEIFLNAKFLGGRHLNRVNYIENFENK